MNHYSADLLSDNKLFGIEYIKWNNASSMTYNHYHNHYEIYYQISGERYYFIKDRSYYVRKGDIVIINKFDLHKTTFAGAETCERVLINFTEEYIEKYLEPAKEINLLDLFKRSVNVYSLNINEQNFVEQLLKKMIHENKEPSYGTEVYLKISLMELLIFLNRRRPEPQHKSLEYPSAMHKKVSQIAKYIGNNYTEPLSLKQLSEQFQISTFYLSRIFKEITGFSIIEYMNITRVKAAQALLLETDLSVTEIAERAGFGSPTHFGRVFKSVAQVSPLKYKKMVSASKDKES